MQTDPLRRSMNLRLSEEEWDRFYLLVSLRTKNSRRRMTQRDVIMDAVDVAIAHYSEGSE